MDEALKPRWRGVLHTGAAVALVPMALVLVSLGPTVRARLALSVYVFGVGAMFSVSALYHRGRWSEQAHSLFRRGDHSTIFLAIAGSYTPLAALNTHGWVRVTLLTLAWGGALVGIIIQWTPVKPPRWLFTAVYAIVGWSAIVGFPQLLHGLGVASFVLIVCGGVAYTVGAVFYGRKKPDPSPEIFGYHEVFHACTILGAVCHYVAIFLSLR